MRIRTAAVAFLFFVGFIGAGTSWADDNCDIALTLDGVEHDVARRPASVRLAESPVGRRALHDNEYIHLSRESEEQVRNSAATDAVAEGE